MNVDINPDSIRIEHQLPATAEKVFRCFTDPEIARKWMAPDEMKCVQLEMNVVVGGTYKLTMENPAGEQYSSAGTYHEVSPYTRLAYDWQWQDGDSPVTQVVIDFEEIETGCLMRFSHSGFATPESAKSHVEGWGGCITKLMAYLESNPA